MSGPASQIVAMGGGGLSMGPRNPRLDRYVLGLPSRGRPCVSRRGAKAYRVGLAVDGRVIEQSLPTGHL
jgi:hypothetical protein